MSFLCDGEKKIAMKVLVYLCFFLGTGNAFTNKHFNTRSKIKAHDLSSLQFVLSKPNQLLRNRPTHSSRRSEYRSKVDGKLLTESSTILQLATNLKGGEILLGSSPLQPGVLPAILSPLSSALGFMIWDNNWRGSAFSLNLVKNVIASVFFFAVLSFNKTLPVIFQSGVPYSPLAISAFLGVVIGDCTAIAALRRLGSRRYLLIDCLKPALSVLIGVVALGENLSKRSIVGITSIVIGVYIASIQKLENSSATEAEQNDTNRKENKSVAIGYAFAVGHLIFDTIGAAITKKCMGGETNLGPLSVGLVRFGAAAIMLQIIGLSANLFHLVFNTDSSSKKSEDLNNWWDLPKTELPASKRLQTVEESKTNYMTRGNWKAIAIGTFFVTFLGPSLFYRSLQFMSLGIGVTLSCTAPLYEPILARILKGTIINGKAILGAILAFIGVATLSL